MTVPTLIAAAALAIAGAALAVAWACVRVAAMADQALDEVLVTPRGVEIPLGWVASLTDLDAVLVTLAEIDQLAQAEEAGRVR